MKKLDKRSKDENLRDRQLRMAVLLAEMKSYGEVASIISDEFKINETRDNVKAFGRTNRGQKIVAFLKKRFLIDLTKIPIANKAVRLKRLENIYIEALTESLKSINQWGEVYELKLGAAIEALKAAREEIEGSKPIIDQSQHKHFHFDKMEGERLVTAAKQRGIPIPEILARRFGVTSEIK